MTLQTLWWIVLSCKPSVLVPVDTVEILHFTLPTKTLILVGRQKTNFMTNKLLAKIRGAVKAVFAILIQSFIGLAWSGWCWWWLGGGDRAEKTENTETGSPGGSKNTCRGSHHYTMAHLWSVNNQSQRRPLGRYYYYIFSVKRIFKGSLPIRFSNNICLHLKLSSAVIVSTWWRQLVNYPPDFRWMQLVLLNTLNF